MAFNFTGALGVEWTLTTVDQNGALLASNFDFGENLVGLPGAGTDIIVGNGQFGTQATISNNVYQNFSGTPVEINSLEVLSGAQVDANASLMTLNGSLVNSGTFNINSDTVTILGGIVNDHLITIDGETSAAYLLMGDGTFTIADGPDADATGDLRLTNGTSGQAWLSGSGGDLTILENESRISGNGYIGWSDGQGFPGGYVSIKNSGVIDANSSGKNLVIVQHTTDANPLENTGSLVANDNGRLIIDDALVAQSGAGFIGAYDAGSRVVLADVLLQGGMLETSGGGIIYLASAEGWGGANHFSGTVVDGSSSFGAVTITDGSLVRIGEAAQTGRTATFKGAIINEGDVGILGYQSALVISTDGATLTGGGDIHLSYAAGTADNTGNAHLIGESLSVSSELINTDNRIHGSGTIGRYDTAWRLSVVNGADGIIEADDAEHELIINQTTSFDNNGLLRATGGAELFLGTNTGLEAELTLFDNAGGTILASGEDSRVAMRAAVIRGGTLDSADDGEIELLNGTFSVLDGSTAEGAVTNEGLVRVYDGTLRGSIVNHGSILFQADGTGNLRIADEGATLSGNGTVTLGATSNLIAESSSDTSTLVNEALIAGGGFIGAGVSDFYVQHQLFIENAVGGVFQANGGMTMVIDTAGTIENEGTLEADGGTLDIRDAVSGDGELRALNGGTLIVNGDLVAAIIFQGTGTETLDSHFGWQSGADISVAGMRTGDRIEFGFDGTVDVGDPDQVGSWSQSGNDASISDGNWLFSFTNTTETHLQVIDDGNGGVALIGVATIDGTDAANTLAGTTGEDRMVGFAGNDTFRGTAGDDIFDGTGGNDTADYSSATGGVTVDLAIDDDWQTIGGGQGDDMFRSVENVTGSRFADTIIGCARVNRIDGGAGNDRITGSGDDTLLGGAGNDTFILDIRGDRISDVSGTDHIRAGFSFTLAAAFENLTLTGTDALNGTGNAVRNILTGNSGKNSLSGLAGNDTLDGAGGNDILIGGVGADRQTGGGGADRFQFKTKGDSTVAVGGRDTILDFFRSQGDRVDLTALDANERKAGNQAFDFIGTRAFGGEAGELRFSKGAGSTLVQADMNGDKKADFAFTFDDPIALIARDFLL